MDRHSRGPMSFCSPGRVMRRRQFIKLAGATTIILYFQNVRTTKVLVQSGDILNFASLSTAAVFCCRRWHRRRPDGLHTGFVVGGGTGATVAARCTYRAPDIFVNLSRRELGRRVDKRLDAPARERPCHRSVRASRAGPRGLFAYVAGGDRPTRCRANQQ
jgi:hypothetical protein